MLKLYGRVSIIGDKASINSCASAELTPKGKISQIGLKQKVPAVDRWAYETPLYRFHIDKTDEELCDFLKANSKLRNITFSNNKIDHAFLTLVPVLQDEGDIFSTIFSREALSLLVKIGLELQISPEVIMPDAPYWIES